MSTTTLCIRVKMLLLLLVSGYGVVLLFFLFLLLYREFLIFHVEKQINILFSFDIVIPVHWYSDFAITSNLYSFWGKAYKGKGKIKRVVLNDVYLPFVVMYIKLLFHLFLGSGFWFGYPIAMILNYQVDLITLLCSLLVHL